jgi:hypothetical protein
MGLEFEHGLSKYDPEIQIKKAKFAGRLEKEGSKEIFGRTAMRFKIFLGLLFLLLELMLVSNPQDTYHIHNTNSTNQTLPWKGGTFTLEIHWMNQWSNTSGLK